MCSNPLSNVDFSKLFHLSQQPMWIFEPVSLRFLEVNEAAIWEYGYTREDFKKMTLLDIRRKEDLPGFQKAVDNLGGDQFFQEPFRHVRRDGTGRPVSIMSYEQNLEGELAYLVVPHAIADEKAPFLQFQQLINKAEYSILMQSQAQKSRLAEMRRLADLLAVGQPVSKQLALIMQLKELLAESPNLSLN